MADPLGIKREDCPNVASHTEHPPVRSTAYQEWAFNMMNEPDPMRDTRCDGCGHYEIWVPNQSDA